MIDFIRQQVLPHFGVTASAKVSPLGNGHINDTFLVRWPEGEFVLQRLNTEVFTQPHALVSNAQKVAEHLLAKHEAGEYRLSVVQPVTDSQGELALDLGDQGFWRAITYLAFSHSIEVVADAAQAESAAKAFGHFSRALSDLDEIGRAHV